MKMLRANMGVSLFDIVGHIGVNNRIKRPIIGLAINLENGSFIALPIVFEYIKNNTIKIIKIINIIVLTIECSVDCLFVNAPIIPLYMGRIIFVYNFVNVLPIDLLPCPSSD